MTNEEAKTVLINCTTFIKDGFRYMKDEHIEQFKEAYRMAIQSLEKQIPKKPYIDNENGVYEKEYCPTCHRSLFPNDHHCRCGQVLDWGSENGYKND